MHGQRPGYLPYVDGLRAVAVLAVVAYHLDPRWLPAGFSGVDIFFVISGFVVSASVASAPAGSLGAFAGWFYARRLRRIAPALLVCLLATGLASALLIPPAWLSDGNTRTGLFAFVGLSNLVLWRNGADYFSPAVEFNPYTHTWSLAVEEQFYLLFPLLFLGWLRGQRRHALGAFAMVLAGSALIAGWWVAEGRQAAAFYLLPARLWQLAAGVVLYQVCSLLQARTGRVDPLANTPWIGPARLLAAAVLAAGLVLPRPGDTPWPDGVLPVFGTLGVIGLLYLGTDHGVLRRVLSWPLLVAVGRGSYSLYLWHWPVFVLMRWTLGLESTSHKALALAGSFLLAALSYRYVERPFRYGARWRGLSPRAAIGGGVVVIVVCALGFRALDKARPELSWSVVAREAQAWLPERGGVHPTLPGCVAGRDNERVQDLVVWSIAPRGCPAPDRPRPRLYVIGDSHATGYAGMLKDYAVRHHVEVRIYQRGGCPLLGLRDRREFDDPECKHVLATALDDVAGRARAGDVLFLPSLRVPRLGAQWNTTAGLDPRELVESGDTRSVRAAAEIWAVEHLGPLAARGVRVVFEAPKPVFRAPAFRCADVFNRDNPACAGGLRVARDAIETLRAPALETLRRIAAAIPGADVWDPLPVLCPGSTCEAIRDGLPLYFDGDHLSGAGNRVLLPAFEAHLERSAGDAPGQGAAITGEVPRPGP